MGGPGHLLDGVARMVSDAREEGVADDILIAVLLEIIEAIRQGADLGRSRHAHSPPVPLTSE
jgi:hypothetical protein